MALLRASCRLGMRGGVTPKGWIASLVPRTASQVPWARASKTRDGSCEGLGWMDRGGGGEGEEGGGGRVGFCVKGEMVMGSSCGGIYGAVKRRGSGVS